MDHVNRGNRLFSGAQEFGIQEVQVVGLNEARHIHVNTEIAAIITLACLSTTRATLARSLG